MESNEIPTIHARNSKESLIAGEGRNRILVIIRVAIAVGIPRVKMQIFRGIKLVGRAQFVIAAIGRDNAVGTRRITGIHRVIVAPPADILPIICQADMLLIIQTIITSQLPYGFFIAERSVRVIGSVANTIQCYEVVNIGWGLIIAFIIFNTGGKR